MLRVNLFTFPHSLSISFHFLILSPFSCSPAARLPQVVQPCYQTPSIIPRVFLNLSHLLYLYSFLTCLTLFFLLHSFLHTFLTCQTPSPCISWSTCETPFFLYRPHLSTLLKIHFWFWPADDLYVETMQLVQTHDQRKVRDCPLEEQMPLAMYYCTALPSCKFVFCSFTLRTSMFKNSVCEV